MIDDKSWYRSKTIWGALVALGASLADLFGVGIDPAAASEIAEAAMNLAVAAGALLSILGRVTAETRIRRGSGSV